MHSIWSDILWNMRFVSPFAFICGVLAIGSLTMYLITKWREFFMIGLTAAIYSVPFLLWGANHYRH
jgi:hypothetical protein